MFDIRYGIYLVIFSMPLYLVRFSVFGVPTTMLEIMIYVLFGIWIMRGKRDVLRALSKIVKEKTLFWGIIFLFSGLAISTYSSSDLRTSLGVAKGWFFDPFLVFLVFVGSTKNWEDLKRALAIWMLSGLAVGFVGIIYLVSGSLTYDGRLQSFFQSPNYLAMYLAPSLLMCTIFLLQSNKIIEGTKIYNFGYWKLDIGNLIFNIRYPIFIIMAIFSYLTRSYGAIFSAILATIYSVFPEIQKRLRSDPAQKRKYALMSFVVVVVFLYLGYAKLIQIENSNKRSSFHSRLMIWEASLKIIEKSPIIGIGPGTFQEAYLSLSPFRKEPYLEWAVTQPHSTYFAFYLQTGIVGFLGFALIIFWFFSESKKTYRTHGNESAASYVFGVSCAVMAYFLIHGIADTTYWKNDLSIMFWLLVGVVISGKNILLEKEKKGEYDRI